MPQIQHSLPVKALPTEGGHMPAGVAPVSTEWIAGVQAGTRTAVSKDKQAECLRHSSEALYLCADAVHLLLLSLFPALV